MIRLAPGGPPPWLRRALAALAALYLGAIGLEANGVRTLARALPGSFNYFTQIACLFPHAASDAIEYRAQGFLCRERRLVELDVRPLFPMHADDKENRFDRALFFYRHSPPALTALDDFLVLGANRLALAPEIIGGVELLSLRLPLPQPGSDFPRYRRRPLEEYPREVRKLWYATPPDRRRARCAASAPLPGPGEAPP